MRPVEDPIEKMLGVMGEAKQQAARAKAWLAAVTAAVASGRNAEEAVALADAVTAEFDRRDISKGKLYFGLSKQE